MGTAIRRRGNIRVTKSSKKRLRISMESQRKLGASILGVTGGLHSPAGLFAYSSARVPMTVQNVLNRCLVLSPSSPWFAS